MPESTSLGVGGNGQDRGRRRDTRPGGNRDWTPAEVARLEPPVLPLEEDYEERLRFPAQRHRIVLRLGGIPIEVRTESTGILKHLQAGYGAFEAPDAEPRVRVAVGEASKAAFPFKTLVGTMTTYSRGPHAIGKFREMAGFVDTAAGRGRALVGDQNYPQDVSNYLRFLLDAMSPPLKAVLFHTAALAHRGKAYLFFGPSTAGKSTVTSLSAAEHEVMTDDMLLLRFEAAALRAASCGFWGGETKCYPTRALDLPVRAFFRLVKAARNHTRPVSRTQATVEILCGVPSIERSAEDRRFLLDFAHRAAHEVPCFDLHFHNRDASFWSVIDDLG